MSNLLTSQSKTEKKGQRTTLQNQAAAPHAGAGQGGTGSHGPATETPGLQAGELCPGC